jgi:signal transduction histidine kinase
MGTMRQNLEQLRIRYAANLEEYLQRRGEDTLEEAYELGRRALAEGLGVLDIAAIHHQALSKIVARAGIAPKGLHAVKGAGEFFAESVAPFEMTHRAFGESNAALSRLNETLEEETKRIAHALHDEAGQLLAAIHITLDEVARGMPSPVRERLQEVRKLLDQIEGQLRQLSHELRPTVLDDFGLMPALEFLAQGVAKRTKHQITVEGFQGERLPAPVEAALYRIVQEALNNVTRHARATRVNVRLERAGASVLCSVADNGIGFDPAGRSSGAKERGLGLLGIRERLSALGGTFEIKSARGRGTDLRIIVPLEKYHAHPSSARR